MKTLILMRHAKSDWSQGGLGDFDRPLNPRGRRSAVALGHWLRENDHAPDTALVSAARRTRETYDELALAACKASFLDTLYHAGPQEILAAVMATDADSDRVLVIGHNPGMGALAGALAPTLEDPDLARYPTGATTVIDFDIDTWIGLPSASPQPRDFIIPRRLTD